MLKITIEFDGKINGILSSAWTSMVETKTISRLSEAFFGGGL